ncbi:MAG: hypothetical protein LUH63_10570 [Parabacteroides sp.]|nr:hypothetical protein [Parabacteroides sp.]
MKRTLIYHIIICLLLPTILCGFSACSNETLIGGGPSNGPDPDGKVTLAMHVQVASLTSSSDPSNDPDAKDPDTGGYDSAFPCLEAEKKIYSLYVFVFNLGTSPYCEAQSFTTYDMKPAGDGYTFEMKVSPGHKRFFLVANPRTAFRADLTSYTQEELQNMKMEPLADLNDGGVGGVNLVGTATQGISHEYRSDVLQATVNTQGVPMTVSVMGSITLGEHKEGEGPHVYDGTLVLDDGSDSNIFRLERAVAKVKLVCRINKNVFNEDYGYLTLTVNSLEIIQANKQTYLFPKYHQSEKGWSIDWPSMAEGAVLTRKVCYEIGKVGYLETITTEDWMVFDKGTHYLYENYFGPTLPGDTQEGLIDETKYSRIHIEINDGRNLTFPLPYLRRNDYLKVTLNVQSTIVTCDIRHWDEDTIYPDYTETVR